MGELYDIAVDFTDKAEHGYCDAYEELLGHRRYEELNLLELGTYKGGGLFTWETYLPCANITGVDIDPQWHHQGRAEVITCDVLDFEPQGEYDVVIDDIHLRPTTALAFEKIWPHVRSGGFYAMEDQTTIYPEVMALGEFTQPAPYLLIFKKP